MVQAAAQERHHPAEGVKGLTVEMAAYGGAAMIALLLRFVLLGTGPLGPAEAAQALPALAASLGNEADLVGQSPLLFGLQRALFVVFGASDAGARVWPALAGGLAPLLFIGLRGPLGRRGAVVAAYLWAISPMAVFVSRFGTGDGLVPVLALAVLSCLSLSVEFRDLRSKRLALIAAGGALGLMLASGPGAYTAVLMGSAAALVWRRHHAPISSVLRMCWKQVLGALVIFFAIGSTFLFTTPDGLAAAADLLGQWIVALRPGPGEYQAFEIGLRLVLSEPVLLGFGLAGFAVALKKGDRFGVFAGCTLGLALAVVSVGGGRHPSGLGLVVLSLTLLAGPAISSVLEAAWSCRSEVDAWLLLAVSTILWLVAALCLPGALNPSNNASWRQLYTAVGIVTAALGGFLWVVYGVWGNWRTVRSVLPLVLLLLGLAWGVAQVSAANYERGAWRWAGVLHETPTLALTDLQRHLLELASLNGTGGGEGPIDLVLPPTARTSIEPLLRWALRSFPNLRVVPSVSPAAPPVVITLGGEQPRLGPRYSGTDVAILRRWTPSVLPDFYSRLRWLLYREAKQPGELTTVILWMKRSELPPVQPEETGSSSSNGQSRGVIMEE